MESIAEKSIVEMRNITPESIIAVTALGDETMDMRIPFEIPAKSMKHHDKTRGKVFMFIYFREHTKDDTGDRIKETIKERTIL